jgi:tRNA(Phe) wybutosine-synthesizing methylase Tyw3
LVGDDGEQSICHHHQSNFLAISNDSEEFFSTSSCLGRTSLLIKRTRGEEHRAAKPAQDLGGPRGRAR